MKTYQVKIEEKLSTLVMVEAESQEEALETVKEMYANCEVVLDLSDLIQTDYTVIEVKE